MKREFQPKGINTPWGVANWAVNYGEGIDCFATPSHGGFRLSVVRRLQMPAGLREFVGYGGPGWYEEDCDWAVVALAFPEVFEAQDVWAAVRTVRAFSDGYGPGVKAWLEGPGAGPAFVRQVADMFDREHAKKFISGCEGTTGNAEGYGWFVSASTIDGSESAVVFEFPGVPALKAQFTREDVKANGGRERPKRQTVHIPDEMPA